MNNIFYVYCLRRLDKIDFFDQNKYCPFYIGKGCNGRINDHRIEAERLMYKSGRKIIKIKIIHKLWKQEFDFQEDILFSGLPEEQAFNIERELINKYGRIDLNTGCLANMTDGGDGYAGAIHLDKTKAMISNSLIGRMVSDETRDKIRKSLTGRELTENVKNKIRESRKGQRLSEETKGKISIANKGRIVSIETRERIANSIKGHPPYYTGGNPGSIPWNKGKTGYLSDEAKLKMSHKDYKDSEETKAKKSESAKKAWVKRKENHESNKNWWNHSSEAIEKIKKARKDQKTLPETKEKLRQIALEQWQRIKKEGHNGRLISCPSDPSEKYEVPTDDEY